MQEAGAPDLACDYTDISHGSTENLAGTLTVLQQPPTEPRDQSVEDVTVVTSPINLTSSATLPSKKRL